MKNKGYNKRLYEKRNSLNLTIKEAAKSLGISKLKLNLIEQGYFQVNASLQNKFIDCYKLDKDFFENDLGYPEIIKEEEVKYVKPKVNKVINHPAFKIGCGLAAIGFFIMTFFGVRVQNECKTNPLSFYSTEIIEFRDWTIKNPDEIITPEESSELKDKFYVVNNNYDHSRTVDLGYGYYLNEVATNSSYAQGSYEKYMVIPLTKETISGLIKFNYKTSFSSGKYSLSAHLFIDEQEIINISSHVNDGAYKYNHVSKINKTGSVTPLNKSDPDRQIIINMFEAEAPTYITNVTNFFNSSHVYDGKMSYDSYVNGMKQGTKGFSSQMMSGILMLIFGIILTCVFIAMSFLYIFKTIPPIEKHIESKEAVIENIEMVKPDKETKPLKKNWKFAPFLSGYFVKGVSIALIFTFSITLFFLFNNLVRHDTSSITALFNFEKTLSPILIIGILLLLFVKLDIIQHRKNYFLINYFYFFAGLAIYILVLIINFSLGKGDVIFSNIWITVLNAIPGNFVWGILAFNMLVYLLFYHPESAKDSKKLIKYRMLAIIPFGYLVTSLILGIVEDCASITLPYPLSYFFFTKSFDLIIFAIAFTLLVFIYKIRTYKKYGVKNALIFQRGNEYYLTKNFLAAGIVLAIGIVEIIFFFACPNNPLGLGKDYLIVCAIPFILLYHPHHGKRNSKLDTLYSFLYGLSYCVGIALILISVIIYFLNI